MSVVKAAANSSQSVKSGVDALTGEAMRRNLASQPGAIERTSSGNKLLNEDGDWSARLSQNEVDLEPAYRPPTLARDDEYARRFPDNVPVYVDPMHYVVSVQSFTSGGYEAVVRMVNAQKIAEQCVRGRPGGARLARAEDERNADDIFRAQLRAKKRVRMLVKEMAADRIVTLTTRESENSVEELLNKWQRWLKLVGQASAGRFHYVAVPEPHPTNPKHFHLHVAVAVYLNVKILRRCWWQVCGGRGMGNIDIKHLKAGAGARRVYKVASYVSKYLTKENVVRFNKKRYWASRVNLAEVRRYWLQSRILSDAMIEAFGKLNYMFDRGTDVWKSESAGVCWFQAIPGVGVDPPF